MHHEVGLLNPHYPCAHLVVAQGFIPFECLVPRGQVAPLANVVAGEHGSSAGSYLSGVQDANLLSNTAQGTETDVDRMRTWEYPAALSPVWCLSSQLDVPQARRRAHALNLKQEAKGQHAQCTAVVQT